MVALTGMVSGSNREVDILMIALEGLMGLLIQK
jgi:hypothetical protein